MNAIILAAGYGTRLRPITKSIPKCMVEINGVPILKIWIDKLFNVGIQKILINTHYLNAVVEKYVKELKEFKDDKIILNYEKNLLGTAGTLIENINFFGNKDGLLIHADNFTSDNLHTFIKSHIKNSNIDGRYITMMTFKTDNPENFGIAKINKNKFVESFYEKQKDYKNGNNANCAIYILKNNFLKLIKNKNYSDFVKEIIPLYVNKIKVFKTKNFFLDIGDLNSLKKAIEFDKNIIKNYHD